jgi:hypothetical protein
MNSIFILCRLTTDAPNGLRGFRITGAVSNEENAQRLTDDAQSFYTELVQVSPTRWAVADKVDRVIASQSTEEEARL